MQATRKLTDAERGKCVKRTAETVRRWRRLARNNPTVSIDDDAAARIEEVLGELPPVDVDAYRQGLREAIRRMTATLEALEAELSAPDAGADVRAEIVQAAEAVHRVAETRRKGKRSA